MAYVTVLGKMADAPEQLGPPLPRVTAAEEVGDWGTMPDSAITIWLPAPAGVAPGVSKGVPNPCTMAEGTPVLPAGVPASCAMKAPPGGACVV